MGTIVYTPEQIAQKWEFEKAGKPWPPPPMKAAPVQTQEDANLALRAAVMGAPIDGVNRNLKTLLDELFKRHGVEPAEELVRMATERDALGNFILTIDQRIKIWSDLLSYRMPRLKAMEVSGQLDHSLTVIVRKFGEGDMLIERARPIEIVELGSGKSQKDPVQVEIKKIS